MNVAKTLSILFLVAQSMNLLSGQKRATISSAEISFVFSSNDTDGSISGFSSSSNIDLEYPEKSTFKGEVKTETLKTGNFIRDWSLKGSKYFNADLYPLITFNSTSVTPTSNGYIVKGDLTIKKTTNSISIKFVRQDKKLTGTTSLYASDYGITVKSDRADNKVSVKMVFKLM